MENSIGLYTSFRTHDPHQPQKKVCGLSLTTQLLCNGSSGDFPITRTFYRPTTNNRSAASSLR